MIAGERSARGLGPLPYAQVGNGSALVGSQQSAYFPSSMRDSFSTMNCGQASGFASAGQQASEEPGENASEKGSWVCFWSTEETREKRWCVVGPQRFRSYLGITKLACGPNQAAFIAKDGRLYCWNWGTCGNMHACSPQLLEGRQLEHMNVVDVSCGDGHLACITAEGRVFTYGRGDKGQRGSGKIIDSHQQDEGPDEILFSRKAIQVSCGAMFTLVLTEDGQVYSFGDGSHGVLGTDSVANRWTPAKVKFHDRRITLIAAGTHHAIAVTDLGSTYTWGKNNLGQLGLGHNDNRLTPQVVSELCGQRTVFVSASDASLAATAGGSVFIWGGGESNTPAPLGRIDLIQIALGDAVYGLTRDHNIWVRPLGSLEEQNCKGQEFPSSDITMLSASGSMLMGVAPGSSFSEAQQEETQKGKEQEVTASSENTESERESYLQENANRKKRVSFSEVVESFATQAAEGHAGRRRDADIGSQNPKSRTMSVPPTRKPKAAAPTSSCTRTRSLSPADQKGSISAFVQPCLRKTALADRPKGRASATSPGVGGQKTRMAATETKGITKMSHITTGGSVPDVKEVEIGRMATVNKKAADYEKLSASRRVNKLIEPEMQTSPQHYTNSHHSTPEFGFTPAGVPVGGSPSHAKGVENATLDQPWQLLYEERPRTQQGQVNGVTPLMGGHEASTTPRELQQHPSLQQHSPHGQPHLVPMPPPPQQPQIHPHPYYQPQQTPQMRMPSFQSDQGLQQHPCPQPPHVYTSMHRNYQQNSVLPWDPEYEARRRMGMGVAVQTPPSDMLNRPDLAALAMGLELQREASRSSLASTSAGSAYEAQLQSLRLKELPIVLAGREAAIGGELVAQKEASELRKALSMARQDAAELEQEKQVLLRELRTLRSDVAEAKSSASKKEQTLESLEDQVSHQKKQIDRLKKELEDEAAQNHRDLKQMLEKINTAEARRLQMQQQLQEAHAYIHRLEAERKDSGTLSAELEKVRKSLAKETAEKEELCKQADAAINDWQNSYAKLQADVEEATATAKKHEEEAEAARAQLQQQQEAFQTEKRVLVQKLDETEEERLANQSERLLFQSIKKQNEEYERACAEHTAELATLKRTEQRLRRDLEELKEEHASAQVYIADLQNEAEKFMKESTLRHETVEDLQQKLIGRENEITRLSNASQQNELEMHKLRETQSDLKLEIDSLQQALKLKEDIIKRQEEEAAEEKSRAISSALLQGQLEDLRQELEICRENEMQATTRMRELQHLITSHERNAAEAAETLEKRSHEFEEAQLLLNTETQKLRRQNAALQAEFNSLKSEQKALEEKSRAFQESTERLGERSTEVRLAICDVAAHLVACAAIFNRRGFLSLECAADVDFEALKKEIESPNENSANEAWTCVCNTVQSLSSLGLPQVCDDVIQKLQNAVETLEARVEEAQEELKTNSKELEEKNASLVKAQELQLQVEALEAEFTRKVEHMSKLEKEKAFASSKMREQIQTLETQLSIARMTVAENKAEITHLRERNSNLLMELSRQEERASEFLAQNERLALLKQSVAKPSTRLKQLSRDIGHSQPQPSPRQMGVSNRCSSLAGLPLPKRAGTPVSGTAANHYKSDKPTEGAPRAVSTPRRLALTPRGLGRQSSR